MEGILLGVLSLSGCFIFSTCLLHQYHFVPQHKTWMEAQAYCRDIYTDMATIENDEEMNQLMNTVTSQGHNFDVFIGLYTLIHWKWSDGNRVEYVQWESDFEPNFSLANQFCVSIGNHGGWRDDYCLAEYPFICYRGAQLEDLVVVNETMNWYNAHSYCRENFRDLAAAVDDAVNQKIQRLVPSGSRAWFGLFRDPNFYWSDGATYSYSYWDNVANLIDTQRTLCGVASMQRLGRWRLESCDTLTLPFVCYSIPAPAPQRQVFKLKIKMEDSSVDVNDPAVKANILKKLQNRLQEKALSRVTLKWREQPDGKVFHREGKTPQEKQRKKTEL